jgi:GT2 family glycosyltransferase
MLAGHGRIVFASEKGAFAARNMGVRSAEGDVLAFIDSDCIADPQWLARGMAALSKTDIASGRIDVFPANTENLTPTEAFEIVFAFNNKRYIEQELFSVTASLFVRRKDFLRVGGFRPFVAEDKEWCHRAVRAGLALSYIDDIVVSHPARQTFAELRRKWERLGIQGYFYAKESTGGLVGWWLRSLLLPLSSLTAVPQVLRSRKISGMRSRLGALAVLIAIRLYRFGQAQSLLIVRPQK